MIYPDLYIVGAQKSGTTSLHRLLASHTDIFFPSSPQEIHFFDIEENYAKGLDWFSALFSDRKNQSVVAQTSPLYMYMPNVPKRIHTVVPSAKIIFILRNPIDRAYSHYWHEIRFGYENLSFVDALEAEPQRIAKNDEYRRHYSYVDRGRYSQQILRFQELFQPTNLLVILQDELKSDVDSVLARCAKFLELDVSGFKLEQNTKREHNRAQIPRSHQLQQARPFLAKHNFRGLSLIHI